MSDAASPDRDEQMLSRLAELDLALAEKIHGLAMAATDAEEINALGRTYQRVARSLRQTLALKSRLKREQAALRRAEPESPPNLGDLPTAERVCDLQDAVGRVVAAAYPGETDKQEALLDDMDAYLGYEVERPDFLTADLADQIHAHCERLDLPPEIAERWRELPPAPWTILDGDEDDDDEDDVSPSRPFVGSD